LTVNPGRLAPPGWSHLLTFGLFTYKKKPPRIPDVAVGMRGGRSTP
jgi:hypothetical protein